MGWMPDHRPLHTFAAGLCRRSGIVQLRSPTGSFAPTTNTPPAGYLSPASLATAARIFRAPIAALAQKTGPGHALPTFAASLMQALERHLERSSTRLAALDQTGRIKTVALGIPL